MTLYAVVFWRAAMVIREQWRRATRALSGFEPRMLWLHIPATTRLFLFWIYGGSCWREGLFSLSSTHPHSSADKTFYAIPRNSHLLQASRVPPLLQEVTARSLQSQQHSLHYLRWMRWCKSVHVRPVRALHVLEDRVGNSPTTCRPSWVGLPATLYPPSDPCVVPLSLSLHLVWWRLRGSGCHRPHVSHMNPPPPPPPLLATTFTPKM